MLWIFTDLLSRAFESWFVPLLGFFLLPWTTLAYAAMWASSDGVTGFEWFIVVLAFFFDLASYAGEGQATQRDCLRRRRRAGRRCAPAPCGAR